MRRTVYPLAIMAALLLTACQQQNPQPARVMQEAQSQQIASLIAGARYLKTRCAYPGLPDDGQIEQAAYRAAYQRGWTPDSQLAVRAETLYQKLLQDATPPATQCAEFRQLLQPFIATLPGA